MYQKIVCLPLMLVCLALASSCTSRDPTSQLAENLSPVWQINFGSERRLLEARAKVLNPDLVGNAQPSVAFTAPPPQVSNEVRLTDGDRLQIDASGKRWLLYRRDEPFVYERNLTLPATATTFQARLDTTGDRIGPVVVTVDTSVSPLPTLAQESLSLTPADTLNLGWQSNENSAIAASELQGYVVLVQLEACDGLSLEEVVVESQVPPETTEVDINTDFARNLLPADAMICNYTAQIKSVLRSLSPAIIDYTVASRRMGFSVVYQ